MSKERFKRASTMLNARLVWEQNQRLYRQMRHTGLPRVSKPFPTAGDGHVSIIDNAIRKLKPYWVGQITSGDRLFNFTSLQEQLETLSDAAADWFHFMLTNRTKLLRKTRVMLDYMLLTGRGILKCTIDPTDDYNFVFEAVNPFFLIMPQEADGFEDADEFVHVRQFTVESYKRLDKRWNTDPDIIKRIRGQAPGTLEIDRQQKRLIEGITYTTNAESIIVYEHWIKTSSGHDIEYYSPQAQDEPLRQTHQNPYEDDGGESMPFRGFQMEVKDEGWYSPRGLGELLAVDEQFATKIVNEWADCMTFVNRPVFTSEKEMTNTANYRMVPGEFMPGNVKAVQMGSPPMSFQEMLALSRGFAEEKAQAPDFGITDSSGSGQQTGGKPRTATENQRIAALQSTGSNDNAMMFREDWSGLGKHCWAMAVQFKEHLSFQYYAASKTGEMPQQALHDQYLIMPDGSPEGWNRMQRFQKAVAAMQTFGGNPNVDSEVLTKDALTAYDANMAQKAFVPTNIKGASEYEDQAMEILLLTANPPFPVTVQPQQDHLSRIKCIIDWMHAAGKTGKPPTPGAVQLVQANLKQHMDFLQKQNPQAAKQLVQQIQSLEQASGGGGGGQPGQTGQSAQGQISPPGQLQSPASNGQPTANGNGSTQKESLSINYKDAPEDIKRQMEKAAGFTPSQLPPEPEPVKLTPARPK